MVFVFVGDARRIRRWLVGCVAATAAMVLVLLAVGATARATNANFCDTYWSAFDSRCWYNGGAHQWANFERGINYTAYGDMWVFEYYYGGEENAHASNSTYKACIWHSAEYHDQWAIMPFERTNVNIGGHIDNFKQYESC
jgi:hypothetical protein